MFEDIEYKIIKVNGKSLKMKEFKIVLNIIKIVNLMSFVNPVKLH